MSQENSQFITETCITKMPTLIQKTVYLIFKRIDTRRGILLQEYFKKKNKKK